jgi:hypothetical protein
MKTRLPLADRVVGGIECPWPLVKIRVRDRYGIWVPLTFRVDTQADFTTLPITLARRQGISFRQSVSGRARGIAGAIQTYRDNIRILIAGREHEWPCEFVEPARDDESGQSLAELLPVLGRAGFLREYAIALDDGYLIITRLGPVRRLLRRCLHGLWLVIGQVHSLEEPL